MAGTDVCYAPVLSLAEAPLHPHNATRGTFATIGGVTQPMPAPRYSRMPAPTPRPARATGADTQALLAELSYDAARIKSLRESGAFGKG